MAMVVVLSTLTALSKESQKVSTPIVYTGIENSPNQSILQNIDPKLMIIYPAPNAHYQVTIFTDVFCPYCRKLHENLDVFLKNGITVRYLLFPLSQRSIPVLSSIICSDQPAGYLNVAMLEGKYASKECGRELVSQSRAIGRSMKVFGTPSIFLEDGRKVSGFMSPQEIVDGLQGRLNFDEWQPKHLRK